MPMLPRYSNREQLSQILPVADFAVLRSRFKIGRPPFGLQECGKSMTLQIDLPTAIEALPRGARGRGNKNGREPWHDRD